MKKCFRSCGVARGIARGALCLAVLMICAILPVTVQDAHAETMDSTQTVNGTLEDLEGLESVPVIEPDPTPEVPVDPTPVPEDPTSSVPSEPPASSDVTSEDPTSSAVDVSSEPPAPEPTDSTNGGGYVEPDDTPSPTAKPSGSTAGSNAGGNQQFSRPKTTLRPNTSGNQDQNGQTTDTAKESNYVVFATVDLRQNSLASSMFYGGIACIAAGVAGIVMLVVLFIRNRRYARDGQQGIFEEIEHAETRNLDQKTQPLNAGYSDDEPYFEDVPSTNGTGYKTHYEENNEADYESGFDANENESGYEGEDYSEYVQEDAHEAQAPLQPEATSYYTDEVAYQDIEALEAEERMPRAEEQPEAYRYTTEEIIREALDNYENVSSDEDLS